MVDYLLDMRALLQRVSSASVAVDGEIVGSIGRGLLVFIAIHKNDTPRDGDWLADRILAARISERLTAEPQAVLTRARTAHNNVGASSRGTFRSVIPAHLRWRKTPH